MFFLACLTLSVAAALFSKEFMSSQTWVVLDKLSDSESLKERIEPWHPPAAVGRARLWSLWASEVGVALPGTGLGTAPEQPSGVTCV